MMGANDHQLWGLSVINLNVTVDAFWMDEQKSQMMNTNNLYTGFVDSIAMRMLLMRMRRV